MSAIILSATWVVDFCMKSVAKGRVQPRERRTDAPKGNATRMFSPISRVSLPISGTHGARLAAPTALCSKLIALADG
jgi:hypothetical protein